MLNFHRQGARWGMKPSFSRVILSSAAALAIVAGTLSAPRVVAARESEPKMQVVAVQPYEVRLFARGTGANSKPDAIVADDQHIFIDYQDNSAKDGSNTNPSTIVEYTLEGKAVRTFSVVGHADGMRIDPVSHLLWVTVNEDANAVLYTIDVANGQIETYQFSGAPHGGGYDDLAFVNGKAFIAASNPNLNSAGVNVFPAVDTVTLQGNTAVVSTVLLGNATATDTTTNALVTLNVTDPDSMTVDPSGNVVLVDQAGSEIVFLHNAATSAQTVTRVPVGTQLDDTVWATTGRGRLFVVDAKQNAVYTIQTAFKPGTVYTEMPSDSGVAAAVGTLDLSTGSITPIAIGFGSPTGLLFVPDQRPSRPASDSGNY